MGNNPLVAGYSQSFTNAAQSYDSNPNELLRLPQGSGAWTISSPFTPIMGVNTGNTIVNSTSTNAITPGVGLWANSKDMPPDFVTQMNFTIEQPLKGNSAFRITWLWSHGTNLDHYYYVNNHPSNFVWETAYGIVPPTGGAAVIGTSQQNTYAATATGPYDQRTWGGITWDNKNGWSNDNALQATYQRLYHRGIAWQVNYVWSKPLRLGGNYFRDGTEYPRANYMGVLGSLGSFNTTGIAGASSVIAPALPPAPPVGTLPWQEYHQLLRFQQYKVDTAIPKQHITFNGVVDLPFGRGKRFLGNVNRWQNEAVGGWQIAGAGQVVSQDFAVANGNWGATNPIKYYKNSVTLTDCQSICQKSKLWFNGYFAPTASAMGKITGLPSGYTVGSAASPAYLSPITFTGTATNNNVNVVLANGTVQTGQGYSPGPLGSNPYSQTILNGPINYNVDLSVFKVFPITESTYLRFNVDAFNALNIQGYQNPNGTTGEILYAPGAVGASSYWSARQIQLTLRLQF